PRLGGGGGGAGAPCERGVVVPAPEREPGRAPQPLLPPAGPARPARRWSFRTSGRTVPSRAVSAWIFCRSSATPAPASSAPDHVAYAQHHCGFRVPKGEGAGGGACGHSGPLGLPFPLLCVSEARCWEHGFLDIQVPVCPLCNVPVPVARGEPPDRAVGEHIDRDCRSDPAQQKRKIFTNKCERAGCRQREMMKLTCERCGRNFCIKHRHPLDHDCSGQSHPTSRAGLAAISRAQGLASSTSTVPSPSRTLPSSTSPSRATTQSPSRTAPPVIALQNGLSEDEALQRALELSLAETKPQVPRYPTRVQRWWDVGSGSVWKEGRGTTPTRVG
uniref:AN1-type domain-containing protein n=1 Tax=Canis lupus familiaris TaxID=9615 RepID=A0A8C0MTE0_CANLF